MPWLETWRAVSARIEGLKRAGELLSSAFSVVNQDPFGVFGRFIMPEIAAIRTELTQLASAHEDDLPPSARSALQRFLKSDTVNASTNERYGLSLIVPFAVFRSEFEYLIRDRDQQARELTELAFEHLRQTLAVDDQARASGQRLLQSGRPNANALARCTS
jgi:hypothetical protein